MSSSIPAISVPGIGSGLDVNTIVSQLMSIEQKPLANLQATASSYQTQLSAYGSVRGALASLQGAALALNSPGVFQTLSAAVADSTQFSASAGAQASAGSYAVTVKTLAQGQKLASGGFANPTDAVGSGTLTIQFGTYDGAGNTFTLNAAKPATTITIDPASNSLAAVRDAINASGAGVIATIVNDGSSAGKRLVLTSQDSGAANGMRVTVADSDAGNADTSGLSQLAYDPTAAAGSGKNLTQAMAAQNATLDVDGIAISKPSNIITDAIQGVTLNLAKAAPTAPTTLTLSRDSSAVQNALAGFINAYNNVNAGMNSLTGYNSSTKSGGVLLGDTAAQSILVRVRALLSQALPSGALTTLSQIGVSFQKDGSLALDSTKLNAAIASNPNDIAPLFAALGRPSDSLVAYSASNSATQAGNYALNVTRLATQGAAQGSAPANTTITAGLNDTLAFSVDGIAASVTIAPGTYTAAALAQQMQSQINGLAALSSAGAAVSVAQSGGVIAITSQRYGAASSVAITGGNASAGLFGAAASTAGVDVAGTINGSPATGSGQSLSGATGTAVEGLSLRVSGGGTGNRGSVVFGRGFADQLNTLMANFLGTNGLLQSRTDGLNASIKDNSRQQDELNSRLTDIEARYRAQFTALDTMISSMNQTSSFLTQQFANLASLTSNSNKA